jgi:co-chaperonin GroES (HSP10)
VTLISNTIGFGYSSIDEAFPKVDPGFQPFGSRVLVQMRSPKKKTKGGIILTDEIKETEVWNTQTAKVVSCGSLAFRNRTTMDPWPEGSWCEPGDFVRCPKYGGDRWVVTDDDGEDTFFQVFDDLNLIGKITGDPLSVKAFI